MRCRCYLTPILLLLLLPSLLQAQKREELTYLEQKLKQIEEEIIVRERELEQIRLEEESDPLLKAVLNTPQSTFPIKENTPIPHVNGEKIIFLTFDDGPLQGTRNVLKVLREEQIGATMFMVGKHIQNNRKLYKEALTIPNLTIANHTYSHANGRYRKFYSSFQGVLKDLKRSNAILQKDETLSYRSPYLPVRLAGRNVFRLPGLSCDDYGLGKKGCKRERGKYNGLAKKGFFIYGWDIEWNYSHRNGKPLYSPQKLVNRIERLYASKHLKRKNRVILLMHDFMFRTKFNGVENLHTLIQLLRERGWQFERIEKYI